MFEKIKCFLGFHSAVEIPNNYEYPPKDVGVGDATHTCRNCSRVFLVKTDKDFYPVYPFTAYQLAILDAQRVEAMIRSYKNGTLSIPPYPSLKQE